jgi:hypothetical protein
MKKHHHYRGLRSILSCALLAVALLALLPVTSDAHSPILLVEDNEDGTILVLAGFSNGNMAAGKPIQLKSQASGAVLWEGVLDENSELLCPKQTEPYTVFFNGGAGHTIEKAGPLLAEGEQVPEQMAKTGQSEANATTMASANYAGEAIVPIPPENYLPLSPDFDDQVTALLPTEPLRLKNANGVVQALYIQQGYQYHNQSNMRGILAMLEEKKAAGKKVEMAINPVGLCLGVTTGYLALEYAIQELYGDDVPDVRDFTISTKTKMGGVWDTWDLYFGHRLSRETAEFGIAPKAYVFTAERRSNGHKLVFTYSKSLAEEIKHLGAAKKTPEKFPKGEFRKAKKTFITAVLTQRANNDFGYFDVVEKNF